MVGEIRLLSLIGGEEVFWRTQEEHESAVDYLTRII